MGITMINKIIRLVGNELKVSRSEILSKSRKKPYVTARKIIAYILKNHYNYTLSRIAHGLRKLDHTTISSYLEKPIAVPPDIIKKLKHIENFDSNDSVNPSMNGKPDYRHVFWETVKAECFICGYEDIVEIHHRIALKNGGSNDIDNLYIVCPNHHTMIHRGLIKISHKTKGYKLINKEKK